MRRKKQTFRPLWAAVIVAMAVALLCLWRISCRRRPDVPPPAVPQPKRPLVLVTGYCNCQKCCSWERSWFGFGRPVYSSGKLKGRPKEVGVTASGKWARKGTIAADPSVYPFGTRLYVPGYGEGVVEDVGGSVKGLHIDVWFPSHAEALKWGKRRLSVSRP